MRWRSLFILVVIHVGCLLASIGVSTRAIAAESSCVQNADVKLRDDPEKEESARKISQFTPLELTGKKKRNWIQVKEYSGRVSWVHRRDVSYAQRCVVLRVKKSNLLEGPGEDFTKVATGKKGEAFLDLGEGEDGFIRVQNASGEKVWIDVQDIWRPTANHLRMSFDKE